MEIPEISALEKYHPFYNFGEKSIGNLGGHNIEQVASNPNSQRSPKLSPCETDDACTIENFFRRIISIPTRNTDLVRYALKDTSENIYDLLLSVQKNARDDAMDYIDTLDQRLKYLEDIGYDRNEVLDARIVMLTDQMTRKDIADLIQNLWNLSTDYPRAKPFFESSLRVFSEEIVRLTAPEFKALMKNSAQTTRDSHEITKLTSKLNSLARAYFGNLHTPRADEAELPGSLTPIINGHIYAQLTKSLFFDKKLQNEIFEQNTDKKNKKSFDYSMQQYLNIANFLIPHPVTTTVYHIVSLFDFKELINLENANFSLNTTSQKTDIFSKKTNEQNIVPTNYKNTTHDEENLVTVICDEENSATKIAYNENVGTAFANIENISTTIAAEEHAPQNFVDSLKLADFLIQDQLTAPAIANQEPSPEEILINIEDIKNFENFLKTFNKAVNREANNKRTESTTDLEKIAFSFVSKKTKLTEFLHEIISHSTTISSAIDNEITNVYGEIKAPDIDVKNDTLEYIWMQVFRNKNSTELINTYKNIQLITPGFIELLDLATDIAAELELFPKFVNFQAKLKAATASIQAIINIFEIIDGAELKTSRKNTESKYLTMRDNDTQTCIDKIKNKLEFHDIESISSESTSFESTSFGSESFDPISFSSISIASKNIEIQNIKTHTPENSKKAEQLKINELSEEIIKYIKNQHGISIRKIATNNGHTMNWTFQ